MFIIVFSALLTTVLFQSYVDGSIHDRYQPKPDNGHFRHKQSGKYVSGLQDAVEYFKEFGYIDEKMNMTNPLSMSIEDLKDVIMDFQQVCSLKQTGKLDNPTIKLMNTPRCANKDTVVHHHHHLEHGHGHFRPERYVLHGTKWERTPITYKITQYSRQAGATPQMIDYQIDKAFRIWEEHINLDFVRSSASQVDIEVRFTTGAHGDNLKFDGTYVLAHAFYPGSGLGGDVHFNDEVRWHNPKTLLYTAVHEIGHSLGLRHSTIQASVMFPHYIWDEENELELHSDDVQGIQEIYGYRNPGIIPVRPSFIPPNPPTAAVRTTTTTTESPPMNPGFNWNNYPRTTTERFRTNNPTTTEVPWWTTATTRRPITIAVNQPTESEEENNYQERRKSEICRNGIIDAITDLQNGTILVFRRNLLLPLDIVGGKLVPGRLKLISDVFEGQLPSDLHAVITRENKKTFYFKGSEYWRTNIGSTNIDDGYPKSMDKNFPGIPTDGIDAAFEWTDHNLYFFKDNEYWKFNPKVKPPVSSEYPLKIGQKNWDGLPSYSYGLNAAFHLHGSHSTFFFKDGRYWKVDDRLGKVPDYSNSGQNDKAYPRDARLWFFGCVQNSKPDLMEL